MLYGADPRLAHRFRDALRAEDRGLLVGDNEPYRVSDEGDYAIPVHGVRRGILHTAFELRQNAKVGVAFDPRFNRTAKQCPRLVVQHA